MGYIDIAEAKQQISRISAELAKPLLLIGGLAVNQYVITRDSQDIDLICDYELSKTFLKKLYPTTEWRYTDHNLDEYRPSYSIQHKHKADYPIVKIGPKIKERGAYRYLDWEKLEKDAVPFKYKDKELGNILVPSIEALCYSKVVSFMGRIEDNREKLCKDLSDIRELTNDDSFRLGIFLNLIFSNNFDVELGDKFHSRVSRLGESLNGSNIGKLIKLFSSQIGTNCIRNERGNEFIILQPRPKPIKPTNKVRLAAFDLDGTLIKGIRHSWTMVWTILNINNNNQRQRKEQFRKGLLSYLDWCKLDGEDFIKHGLNRKHFEEIAKINHLSVTKNLQPALKQLRDNGIKTAIISGGIDSLLYALIPNADDLFDEILINRFIFSNNGELERISATEYDWDDSKVGIVGKRRGLERICEKYDISVEDAAFIGDDLNDLEAMKVAGLKIFYCAETREFALDDNLPAEIVIIPSNDLLEVAQRILHPPMGEQVD